MITNSLSFSNVSAIKNPTDKSVTIYSAVGISDIFEISVGRYVNKELCEYESVKRVSASIEGINSLILEMCHEELEPCHLKDVVRDFLE